MADRRKEKTKRAITAAFLSLLKEKEINRITVYEICDAAELGRGTFYLHYQDIYDLYSKIENEVLTHFLKWMDNFFLSCAGPEQFIQFIESIAGYLFDNREIADIFVNGKVNEGFFEKIKDIIRSKQLELYGREKNPCFHNPYQLEYEASAMSGILQYWIRTGMTETPEEIAKIIFDLHGSPV